MTKMLRLIGNEWKKEFLKTSMRVMVILLACLTVLSALLGFFNLLDNEIFIGESFEEFCQNEIEWNEEMLAEGKNDPESILFYQSQLEAHRIMLEAGMDWEDWRYVQELALVAAEAKIANDTATYEELLAIIRSNDPVLYFEREKRSYEQRYAEDPERLEIYVSAMDFCMAEGVIPHAQTDWRYGQVLSMISGRETVLVQERLRESGGAWSATTLEDAKNTAALAAYRLENDMEVNPADSFGRDDWSLYLYGVMDATVTKKSLYWDAMSNSEELLTVVSILVIIVAGGTIANEFSAGTIKFLLMAPIRRWKILVSKYAMVIMLALALSLSVGLLSALSALPLGIGDVLLPAVFAKGGEVYTLSPYLLVLGNYGLAFLEIVVMASLAFAISALTRKASGAIAITVFLLLSGSMISSILYVLDMNWGRYLLFSNLDLAAIADGTSLYAHQSLGGAIVIIVLHLVVFLFTAHDAFVRREI